MKWTSREIDHRNQLHGLMRYQIKCDIPGFFDARNWCWENFGPGIEYEHFANFAMIKFISDVNSIRSDNLATEMAIPRWCWDATKWRGSALDNGKIYIANDADMSLFSLRWS